MAASISTGAWQAEMDLISGQAKEVQLGGGPTNSPTPIFSSPGPDETSSTATTAVPVTSTPSTSSTEGLDPSSFPGGSSSATSSQVLVTAMPTDTPSSTAVPTTTTDSPTDTAVSGSDASDIGNNSTLVITLSTVLSVVGCLLIVGTAVVCWRYRRRRRVPFFSRGISPIDDDEIATWKVARDEKAGTGGETDVEAAGAASGAAAGAGPAAATAAGTGGDRSPGHAKHTSTSSAKKAPSVIVYNKGHGSRQSADDGSPRSTNHTSHGGKTSFDKELPQTPIQARAPNARAGLTDESIPGDDPFLPSPKRHPSRLAKMPPHISSPRSVHTRTRSSRSSTRSFSGYGYAGSELELAPRHSHDNYQSHNSHSRIYSSSSIPPRLSFGEDGVVGGLSPRPSFRDQDIGRAIG
ncbi:hypothetical protein QBC46DRAFT_433684 [Diplogelasinospora grovesii]|uniref:Uncharacterized protein n=1 Tax=Diplogelasinospora grovesii TaxID=303347 RepID=A0AAN6NHS0_9PEZI|nr:hypothetical protein QBC46DRAFT_433684 [Diplogelasinospora grovesii]